MPRRRTTYRNHRDSRLPAPIPTESQSFAQLFARMTTSEKLAWVISAYEWLTRKKFRERAYLDRRAARGTFTPTDEAYEQDQVMEVKLLDLLDLLKQSLQAQLAQEQ
jgi:hypothetical protein